MDSTPAGAAVRAVVDKLTHSGYTSRFCVDADGALCCEVCGTCQPPTEATVIGAHSVDEALVLVVSCPACRGRGAAVVTEANDSSGGVAALLAAVAGLRPAAT